MGFKRKYKFNVIDHLYYMGRIPRIYKWYMPLEAIFFAVFGYIPPFLIVIFLSHVMPLWLLLVLFFGWIWAETEVYSKIEKKCFTQARERAHYRRYPERKDKNYFWIQLLLPLCLFPIDIGIILWLFFVYQ